MRLFIGIELPDALKSSAAAAANRVRERVARDAPAAQVRWVAPFNLHITIWFLGEVREPRVEALAASLKEPLDARPFTLRVGGAGAFPPSGAPRAIWLGLVAGREGLVAIHDRLRPRLTPLGFEPETRPFSPHLTIARVKDARPGDGATMRRALWEATDDVGECEVVSATLFASRPTPTGSQYEAMLRVTLSASHL
jgi:2'-5' RNA ligase